MDYVTLKMTWQETLPTMLLVQRDAEPEGVNAIRPEFERMAFLADLVSELLPALITARNALGLVKDGIQPDLDANLAAADKAITKAEGRAEQ